MDHKNLAKYIYTIADNTLILGQRLSELCGHGPSLETDIAGTNIALDLLGQTRSYYQYAAQVLGEKENEDTIAFLRKEREYRNVLLVEQPNIHFGYVMVRQLFFDVYHLLYLEKLQKSNDQVLAAIAQKAIKEVKYHFRFSSDWVKRLGDGTEVSNAKVQEAVNDLWKFTNEFFEMTEEEKEAAESKIGVDNNWIKDDYYQKMELILRDARVTIPDTKWFRKGGKEGVHSEHMGYLLADLQYMQRTYPNMQW